MCGDAEILGILVCLDSQNPTNQFSVFSAKLRKSVIIFFCAEPQKDPKIHCRTCLVIWRVGFRDPSPGKQATHRLFGSRVLKMACCLTWGSVFMTRVLKSLDLDLGMYEFHDSGLEKRWCGWIGGMVFVTLVPKNRPSTLIGGLFGSRVLKMACCLTWGCVFMTRVLKSLDLGPRDVWFS